MNVHQSCIGGIPSTRIAAALLLLWAAPAMADNFNQVCAGSGCPAPGTSPNGVTVHDNGPQITFNDTAGAPRVQLLTNFSSKGEQGFFVYSGSGVPSNPFAIFAGAPEDALVIDANGFVGVGVQAPLRQFEVAGRQGLDTAIRVTNDGPTSAVRPLLELFNFGAPQIALKNLETGAIWKAGHFNLSFALDTPAGPGNELLLSAGGNLSIRGSLTHVGAASWKSGPSGTDYRIDSGADPGVELSLTQNGNLTIEGALSQSSDVHAKYDIAAVDGASVLDRIESLPIATWRYKADRSKSLHLGPMAQDFRASFGLGDDERRIAPMDAAGVALAGIKELVQAQKEKDAEIIQLRATVTALEKRLQMLERLERFAPVDSGLQKTALKKR